jgi:uncharacterized protein
MNTIYISALIGGITIGVAALLLAGGLGRVMGMSGILKGILPKRETGFWRYLFLAGIPLGSAIYLVLHPNYTVVFPENQLPVAILSGILVGLGTSLANGCTSGHSVCGIGRFSIRSIIATILFVTSGIITVFITHHIP